MRRSAEISHPSARGRFPRGGTMAVEFRLLGPVEADIDGRPVELGHARQRCVLAVLLIEAGRVVPVEALLDRVWADRLPHRARPTLSGYLSRLRHLMAAAPEV